MPLNLRDNHRSTCFAVLLAALVTCLAPSENAAAQANLSADGPGKDCTIEQVPRLGWTVIRGACFGHSLAARPGPLPGCVFTDGPSIFTVTDCVVDGKFIAGRMNIAKPTANAAIGAGGEPLTWTTWPPTPVPPGNSMRVHDVVVGSGEEVTGDRAAIVNLASYEYAAASPEFKGARRSSVLHVVSGPASIYEGAVFAARGMRIGGRRLVMGTTPSPVYGETPTFVVEMSIVRVGPKPEMEAMAQRMRLNGGKTDEDVAAERESIRARNAKASMAYSSLLIGAQASTPDMTVLGIVLGGRWAGVQDVNDCEKPGWALGSAVPFCTPASAAPKPGTRDTTCAAIGSKFDTSWIGSTIGVPDPDGSLVGDLITSFFALSALTERCRLTVGVLASGEVGYISIPTSRRTEDVRTIVQLLAGRYGETYRTERQEWTVGRSTSVYTWTLPMLQVVYTQQLENMAGTAFDGGSVRISTAAWKRAVEAERAATAKPKF